MRTVRGRDEQPHLRRGDALAFGLDGALVEPSVRDVYLVENEHSSVVTRRTQLERSAIVRPGERVRL